LWAYDGSDAGAAQSPIDLSLPDAVCCVTLRTSRVSALGRCFANVQGRIAMRLATQNSSQLQTIFGGGYVPEQHADRMHWNLSLPDVDEVIESLTASMFCEMMNSLRSALSLR
jgi:hypothetical protein